MLFPFLRFPFRGIPFAQRELGRSLGTSSKLGRQTVVVAAAAIQSARPTTACPAMAHHLPLKFQVRFRSNRSRRGLYDGKDIQTGNNVSFSMKATKRKFRPNVFVKRVYSEILDTMVRFHLTASTLRSIDKAGGLDNYLLNPKKSISEGEGYEIKKKILKRLKNQRQIAARASRSAASTMANHGSVAEQSITTTESSLPSL